MFSVCSNVVLCCCLVVFVVSVVVSISVLVSRLKLRI